MTIQLTIHVDKWQYNRLYTSRNDYTIDYVHSQMTIQLTMYTVKRQYNWLYIHSQKNIQSTIHVAKWLCSWL